MLTKDFYFDLPAELIAQTPSLERGNDKLMVLDKASGKISHYALNDLPDLIPANALMIFNNSRVRRSRVFANEIQLKNHTELQINTQKETQKKPTEFLFLNSLDNSNTMWKVMVKNAKKQKEGKRFVFADGTKAVLRVKEEDKGTEFRTLECEKPLLEAWFEKNGHIPLPPYIKRVDTQEDGERYQTVYAKNTGSAAAPTAGLHFTPQLLQHITQKGIETAFITLHVGLGTFLPVRVEKIENHTMHEEFFYIDSETAAKIQAAYIQKRPIVAVGTTTVRTLESAWDNVAKKLKTGNQSTRIFMYPGYEFKLVSILFTNFHTPESTLLMLVSAFAGKEKLFAAYNQAIEHKYRFFSYGDAMLIR